MPSQKPLSQKNSQKVLSFAALLIIGFCMLIFTATSSAQRTTANMSVKVTPTPEPLKSTVRGQIVYEDTGRPVRRSTFSLLGIRGYGGNKSGLTDDNGSFVLKNVDEGKYFVIVNAPGVLNLLSYIDFSAKLDNESRDNTLAEAGKNFEEINVPSGGEMNIFVRAKHGGAIGGRVYYADGAPAIGVKVEMLRKIKDKFVGVISNFSDLSPYRRDFSGVKTDDRGVYRASGLPPGDYIVKVSEPASHNENSDDSTSPFGAEIGAASLLSTYHPDADDSEKAVVINLEIGQEVAEINITLPERAFFTATGIILAKGTQNPVNGAKISIKRKEDVFTLSDRVGEERGISADEHGAWNFKDLPAGSYLLTVKPPTDSTSSEDYDENGNLKPNQKPKPKFAPIEKEITITDKSLSDIKIELPLAGRISGTVSTDTEKVVFDSLQISVIDDQGETVATATSRTYDYKSDKPLAKPEFALENLPTGNFYLSFSTTSYRSGRLDKGRPVYYLKDIKADAKNYLTAPFRIEEGTSIEKVQSNHWHGRRAADG